MMFPRTYPVSVLSEHLPLETFPSADHHGWYVRPRCVIWSREHYTSASCMCKKRAENTWYGGELKRLEIASLETLTLGSISLSCLF